MSEERAVYRADGVVHVLRRVDVFGPKEAKRMFDEFCHKAKDCDGCSLNVEDGDVLDCAFAWLYGGAVAGELQGPQGHQGRGGRHGRKGRHGKGRRGPVVVEVRVELPACAGRPWHGGSFRAKGEGQGLPAHGRISPKSPAAELGPESPRF